MGVHRKKDVFLKKCETVHNKKFIHMKNHPNEQVVIELVFQNFHPYEKASGYYNIHPRKIQQIKKLCKFIKIARMF